MTRITPMEFDRNFSPGSASLGSGMLLLKIDLLVLPLLIVASNLAFLDKVRTTSSFIFFISCMELQISTRVMITKSFG